MNNFCNNCGARLLGPTCGACGRPDYYPPAMSTMPTMSAVPAPQQRTSRATIVASVAVTVLVLAMVSTVFLVWHPFSKHAEAKPAAQQRAATSAPHTVISVQPAPSTVTVTRRAPRVLSDSGTDDYSDGALSDVDPTGDVTDCEVGSDGSNLVATVWVQNNADRPLDVIGTLTFTSTDGTWLGQGGFSAAALDAGDSIDTYVDTADANDPHADQISDPSPYYSDVVCTVDGLRTKTP